MVGVPRQKASHLSFSSKTRKIAMTIFLVSTTYPAFLLANLKRASLSNPDSQSDSVAETSLYQCTRITTTTPMG